MILLLLPASRRGNLLAVMVSLWLIGSSDSPTDLQEFDFVLSDMALEVIGDFAVVWLLSPKKSFSPQANTAFARYINNLPGHCLQVSP